MPSDAEASLAQLNPVQRHGAELYARMCAVCHGKSGEGYKADQATALAQPDFLASVPDALLRTAITEGRTGTTMSAWATTRGGPLSASDIEAVIAFIHSWAQPARAALDEHSLTGDVARGASTYQTECVRCHGNRGTGGPNVSIGNPQLLGVVSNGFLRHVIRQGRKGTPMEGFRAKLADQGVDDVVVYLRSLQAQAAKAPPRAPAPPPPLPLGPVPLNPHGPAPLGFKVFPATTPADVVKAQLVDRKARMVLLDARAPSDYMLDHIAGAVSVPFYDPAPYLDALPKDAWLVAYCACPHAESGTLAQKLLDKGFKQVTVLDEGLGVWKSKQYPTHTGQTP